MMTMSSSADAEIEVEGGNGGGLLLHSKHRVLVSLCSLLAQTFGHNEIKQMKRLCPQCPDLMEWMILYFRFLSLSFHLHQSDPFFLLSLLFLTPSCPNCYPCTDFLCNNSPDVRRESYS
jgi:hypothetical protein